MKDELQGRSDAPNMPDHDVVVSGHGSTGIGGKEEYGKRKESDASVKVQQERGLTEGGDKQGKKERESGNRT